MGITFYKYNYNEISNSKIFIFMFVGCKISQNFVTILCTPNQMNVQLMDVMTTLSYIFNTLKLR